jgi:hypothetical protein
VLAKYISVLNEQTSEIFEADAPNYDTLYNSAIYIDFLVKQFSECKKKEAKPFLVLIDTRVFLQYDS